MKKNCGCALLAGGAGSRMGNINKAELKYRGMTFAEKAVSELAGTGMPCYLSVANYEQTIPEGWKLVKDRVRGEDGGYIGPMGGVFSCLSEAAEDGLEVRSSEIVSDDPVLLKDKITALMDQNDIVFTTGGASNGDKDHAALVMEELGFAMLFRKVDMKPGACMLAGVRNGKILICLSGSPGAALTSYLRVAQPLVRKMTGRTDIYPKKMELRLESGFERPIPHTRIVKGNIVVGEDGYAYFRENPRQLNGMIYGFANMGVIADVPVNDGPTPAGTAVICRMLEE